MKKIIINFIFLFTPFFLFAQYINLDGAQYIDIIKTVRGDIFQGKINKMTDDELVIDIIGNHILTIKRNEIAKIEQKCLNCNVIYPNRKPESYHFKEVGTYSYFSTGIISGNSNLGGNGNFGIGKMKSRKLGYGGGLGLHLYPDNYGTYRFLPVFAEAKTYFSATRFAPYAAFRAGYGFSLRRNFYDSFSSQRHEKNVGGYFINPAIGIRWGAKEDFNFFSELSFLTQRTTDYFRLDDSNLGLEWRKKRLNRLNFTFGLLF